MEEFQDQQFVDYVVRALVDNPDAVSTERTVDEMGVLITLSVDPNDLGQVIGRQGQTAKALRTLLRVVGAKNQARVNLKIDEPDRPDRGPRPMREQAPVTDTESEPAPAAESTTSSAIDDLDL